jgi:HTH-type transcriptional regulator, sugar sensing transcriptional regulator
MDLSALEEIGLTTNEAKTYLELSRAGSISAGNLAKRVDMHRSRMYEALDRLIRKGLVHFIEINNVKHYEAQQPEKLLELLDEKKEQVNRLIPQLRGIQSQPESVQKLHGYQGIGGIKTLLTETQKTKEYVVFGGPQSSIDIMGETYWKNYNQKNQASKIKSKIIFDESLRYWSPEVKKINKHTQIKYLAKHFDNLTQTFAFDDTVIIITWSAQPLGILIKDKTIAKSYKQFFEMLWKQSKG